MQLARIRRLLPARHHELASHVPIWACSFAYLLLFGVDTEIRLDFAEELLRGRHLHEHGGSFTHGIRSTLPEYRHGSSWVHFLALLGWLGVPALLLVKHALSASAVTLVYRLARTIDATDRAPAAASAAIAVGLFALATEHQGLWNMALVPLPVAVLSLLLLRGVTGGSTIAFVACGLVLGLCVDVLVATALLGPVLIVASAAAANRPVIAVAGACAASVVIPAISSPDAWRTNLSAALDDGAAMLALLAFAGAIAVGVWARRRVRTWPSAQRTDWLIAASCGSVAVICLAAALLTGLFKVRYLIVIVPYVSAAAPTLLARRLRRKWPLPAVAGALLVLPLVLDRLPGWVVPTTPVLPRYSYGEAEAIATAARREGFAFRDLAGGLRGPDEQCLLAGMAVEGRAARAVSTAARSETLRVLKLPELDAGRVPAGWRAVELPTGDHAILGPLDGWVHRDEVQLCRRTRREQVCRQTRLALRPTAGGEDWFLDGVLPRLEADEALAGAERITYALPVRIAGGDPERVVQLTMFARGRWWIERVTGLAHVVAPDRQSVTLRASSARVGTLVFGSDPAYGHDSYLPSYVETRPGEDRIRSWLALPAILATVCAEVECY